MAVICQFYELCPPISQYQGGKDRHVSHSTKWLRVFQSSSLWSLRGVSWLCTDCALILRCDSASVAHLFAAWQKPVVPGEIRRSPGALGSMPCSSTIFFANCDRKQSTYIRKTNRSSRLRSESVSGTAESLAKACRLFQSLHFLDGSRQHRDRNHLGNLVAGMDFNRGCAQIGH